MNKLMIACMMCTAGFALATGEPAKAATPPPAGGAAAAPAAAPAGDMMSQWKHHKADAKKDAKGLEAAMKTMMEAYQKGDIEAAAGTIDFPVLMVTDNSAGNGMSTIMTKEQWTGMMKPSMESM